MSWALFTSIVDQVPDLARAVLHGVGEPMMVKELPRMIRYLKERGVYVLFNTNGTLLAPRKRRELIETGLDELRVSLDAADAAKLSAGPRQGHVRPHRPQCRRVHGAAAGDRRHDPACLAVADRPQGDGRPAAGFRAACARIGVTEVYLQRLVFDDLGRGLARAESSLFERTQAEEEAAIAAAQAFGRELGVTIDASGATEPGISLKRGEG